MNKREQKSAIVFTSSIAGTYEHPGMAAYSATKGFVTLLAKSLYYEVKDSIDVLSFNPGLVSSNMIPLPAGSRNGDVVSANEAVTDCLRNLGHVSFTYGCETHSKFAQNNNPEAIDIGTKYLERKKRNALAKLT